LGPGKSLMHSEVATIWEKKRYLQRNKFAGEGREEKNGGGGVVRRVGRPPTDGGCWNEKGGGKKNCGPGQAVTFNKGPTTFDEGASVGGLKKGGLPRGEELPFGKKAFVRGEGEWVEKVLDKKLKPFRQWKWKSKVGDYFSWDDLKIPTGPG